jgi:hypothetical protein
MSVMVKAVGHAKLCTKSIFDDVPSASNYLDEKTGRVVVWHEAEKLLKCHNASAPKDVHVYAVSEVPSDTK